MAGWDVGGRAMIQSALVLLTGPSHHNVNQLIIIVSSYQLSTPKFIFEILNKTFNKSFLGRLLSKTSKNLLSEVNHPFARVCRMFFSTR